MFVNNFSNISFTFSPVSALVSKNLYFLFEILNFQILLVKRKKKRNFDKQKSSLFSPLLTFDSGDSSLIVITFVPTNCNSNIFGSVFQSFFKPYIKGIKTLSLGHIINQYCLLFQNNCFDLKFNGKFLNWKLFLKVQTP